MNTPFDRAHLRLESLIDINQLLMTTVEPDDLIKVIMEAVMRLFDVEACTIGLIDEAEHQLVFAFSTGKAEIKEFRIELGQGIAGCVAKAGEGVICNDASQDSRFFDRIDRKTGFRTKSILCAPLRQSGELIGSIEALNTKDPNGFTKEDLKLLTALGGLAGTAINRAKVFAKARNSNLALLEVIQNRYRFVMGKSKKLETVIQLARTAARSNATVVLSGESGTGKEIMARSIHQWSPRHANPFVAVNCVALTPELIESELFGHEKGSFTGAIAQKKGKFELADGGTIFLDEIGELSPRLQTKLLRVLQEREVQRVGGTRDIRTDVRVIAATNRDLRQLIRDGDFREDLFYRLNVVSITLPPLRERKEDIPGLVDHFIERYSQEMKRPLLKISPSAMDLLINYNWSGNVRELQNVIERAVVLSSGSTITEADLPVETRNPSSISKFSSDDLAGTDQVLPMVEATDRFKRALILKALEKGAGNQAEAARLLGMQRSNFSRLMRSLGLR